MTQIISATTPRYVLFASDRRLTALAKDGTEFADTSKVVNVSDLYGVGYTGLATLDGMPTHEWIGIRLGERRCLDLRMAAVILQDVGAAAFSRCSVVIWHAFLIAGWLCLSGGALVPKTLLVTNALDDKGVPKAAPDASFHVFEPVPGTGYVEVCAAPPIWNRVKRLQRHLGRLEKRNVSPDRAARALVDEIVDISANRSGVGNKILAFCLPKTAAERVISRGGPMIVASTPSLDLATFYYYEPDGLGLRHFAPIYVSPNGLVGEAEACNSPGQITTTFRIIRLPT